MSRAAVASDMNITHSASEPVSGAALSRSRSRYKGNRSKPPFTLPGNFLQHPEQTMHKGVSEISSHKPIHVDCPESGDMPQESSKGRKSSQTKEGDDLDNAQPEHHQRKHPIRQRYAQEISSPRAPEASHIGSSAEHSTRFIKPGANGVKQESRRITKEMPVEQTSDGMSVFRTQTTQQRDDPESRNRFEPDSRSQVGALASLQSLRSTGIPRNGRSTRRCKPNQNAEAMRGGRKASLSLQEAQYPIAARPAFDAPVSAVNAGERRVAVRYDKSVVSVPVTPSTTAIDVIRDVSSQLSVTIDVNISVLLESFGKLGLERPLRKYEHVRNVLNSWDDDAQNSLMIVPSPTGGMDDDLDIKHVPTQRPDETSLQIYHSQRLGCWDKKVVTLRVDGQVLAARKDSVTNICHLSDFDIYLPTKRQITKKIRPPRKMCFAIKSQQKSSVFLSTENFVHFFCTKDKHLATQWYNAVQQWRSWYLVHIMGEGQKNTQRPLSHTVMQDSAYMSSNGVKHNPLEGNATGKLALRPRRAAMRTSSDSSAQMLSTRSHGPPPVSFPSMQPKTPEVFNTVGLLGRSYTQRKQAQQIRDGQSSGSISSRRPGTHGSQPKPLVDLTPKHSEPPQHRKGKGVVPEQMPVGGLIEVATSPDRPIDIPPLTTWQRLSDHPSSTQRSRTVRGHNNSGSPGDFGVRGRQGSSSPEKRPFGIKGLLANENRGQGDASHGRGVRTGDREAKAPMMDMTEASRYASGSLLASVERHQGTSAGPVIERERRREIEVAVGEGVR